jgi:hypothetical protein
MRLYFLEKNGGNGEARTPDLLIKSERGELPETCEKSRGSVDDDDKTDE